MNLEPRIILRIFNFCAPGDGLRLAVNKHWYRYARRFWRFSRNALVQAAGRGDLPPTQTERLRADRKLTKRAAIAAAQAGHLTTLAFLLSIEPGVAPDKIIHYALLCDHPELLAGFDTSMMMGESMARLIIAHDVAAHCYEALANMTIQGPRMAQLFRYGDPLQTLRRLLRPPPADKWYAYRFANIDEADAELALRYKRYACYAYLRGWLQTRHV